MALAIIREVFKDGFVKNKILEFIGPGIRHLSMDYRNGIDVMTTETTCLSSIWETDETTRKYLAMHGREDEYRELKPARVALYDGMLMVDLSRVESMIALPFHPSNAYTIQPDTIARIRTDYVHEHQSRYRTAIADLENRIISASTSERVKLNKQLTKVKAQDEELRLYEEKIHHLADQMISIDLDDGVKVNYAKFADVLAKIK